MFTVEFTFEQYNTILTAIKKEISNTAGNEAAQTLFEQRAFGNPRGEKNLTAQLPNKIKNVYK